MKRIKVLHVLTTTAGGLGQSVLSIVLHLDPEKFDVAVAFGPGYPMDERFMEKGFRVFPVHMKRGLKWINLIGLWDLYRLLRKERFDIVHAHSSIAGCLGRLAARITGVPVVIFSLHGYATLDHRRRLIHPFLWSVEKLLDKCTDHYVAICSYVEQEWIRRGIVSPDRVAIIYHGVDPGMISDRVGRFEKRKELGLSLEGLIVGTVGLLEEQKGTEYFIRAIPLVLQSFPDCRFLVVGDGPLRDRLEKMADELGILHSVKFLGWRDDAVELIGVFDVFCLPSLREGFNLTLLEAMAQAKPIVATDVTGNPEAVVNGQTGLLVPPKNPVALSKALVHFLNDREVALEAGRRGRSRLMERFTLEKMRQQYESLYLSAVQKAVRED